MKYLIEIFWSDEDEGYIAVVPDLPGCSAFGATAEAAGHEINDAIAAWIEACEAAGETVPEPAATVRQARPVTAADLDWLAGHRVGQSGAKSDAAALVSNMRDDDGR